MDDAGLVQAACAEIVEQTQDRGACLIFASGVRHGQHMVESLVSGHGVACGFITAETTMRERNETLARFRSGTLKYLCNVNVLTTGFDAPNIDCVALVRPTMSPGLYYQMVGRGFRLHLGKQNCLVLDFGGNVLRHGPVDAPAKECAECLAVIAAGYARCPQCAYEFPPRQRSQHESKASDAAILSGQITEAQYTVRDMSYRVHVTHGGRRVVEKAVA
jgi:DNA repair protein RadD